MPKMDMDSMPHLYVDELISYFKDIEKELNGRGRPRYDDYVFPVQITAEYIANKFGVCRASAFRKLKELEEDDILISKKGNVKGKPRKKLVFFLRQDFSNSELDKSREHEKPFADFGYRELLYEKYSKTYELKPNGDAILTAEYRIRNISNKEISEIPIPKRRSDTYDEPNLYERVVRVDVNGKTIPYSSDALTFYRKSMRGPIMSLEADRAKESKYGSEITYIIPLEKKLEPSNTVQIKLVVYIPKAFSNLFEIEGIGFTNSEITMKASIRIIAPKGHCIKNLTRYKDISFNRGIIIKDTTTEIRKTDLEEEISLPEITENAIYWKIEKPIMGYVYAIPFMVAKNSRATS